MEVSSTYSEEISKNIIIVDGIEYLPEDCSSFKKKDLLWNPFWFETPVIVVPNCTLSIASYNSLLDCYKLIPRHE